MACDGATHRFWRGGRPQAGVRHGVHCPHQPRIFMGGTQGGRVAYPLDIASGMNGCVLAVCRVLNTYHVLGPVMGLSQLACSPLKAYVPSQVTVGPGSAVAVAMVQGMVADVHMRRAEWASKTTRSHPKRPGSRLRSRLPTGEQRIC